METLWEAYFVAYLTKFNYIFLCRQFLAIFIKYPIHTKTYTKKRFKTLFLSLLLNPPVTLHAVILYYYAYYIE